MLRVKYVRPMNPSRARLAAGRRVCRKYRNAYIRKLQHKEYEKLRSMVPALAGKQRANRVSKIMVIEETIRYIDALHHALTIRVQSAENAVSASTDPPLVPPSEEAVTAAAHAAFLEASVDRLKRPPSSPPPSPRHHTSPLPTSVTCSSVATATVPTATVASLVTSPSLYCENERQIPSYVIQSDVMSRHHRSANQT